MEKRLMFPSSKLEQNLLSRTYGLKTLIADFDSASLETLSSFLKELGMEIITAKDGLTALELFRSQGPQIVFLEAMLPKMSGFELSQQIYLESQGKVPVVIITGIYKDSRHKVEAIQTYKAAAFLTKPWQREELARTILNVLGPNVKPEEEEEELILESIEDITPIIKDKIATPRNKPSTHAQPSITEAKIKGPTVVSDEVEKLLEKTLAELGFESKKKTEDRSSKHDLSKEDFLKISEAKKIAPAAESRPTQPAQPEKKLDDAKKFEFQQIQPPVKSGWGAEIKKPPEIKGELPSFLAEENLIDKEKQPFASSASFDKKEAEAKEIKLSGLKSIPFQPDEKKPELRIEPTKSDLYSTYLAGEQEEKKRLPFLLLTGVAGALALALLGIFVFRPKKEAPLIQPSVAETEKVVSELSQDVAPRLEEQDLAKKQPEAKEITPKIDSRLSSILPVNKEEPPVEEPPILIAESGPVHLALPQSAPPPKTEGQSPTIRENIEAQSEINPASQSEPPSPQIKEGDLVPLEEVDVQPRPIKVVEPKYPEVAKQMGLEGTVVVNALVSERGDVLRAEIIRGIKNGAALEQAALTAIRQWKFSPALKNGVKVKVWKPIETRFRLRQ